MICPYNRKQEMLVLQWNQESDGEENTNCQQLQRTEYTMLECPKEGCAVWHDGHCHYAAVSLLNE